MTYDRTTTTFIQQQKNSDFNRRISKNILAEKLITAGVALFFLIFSASLLQAQPTDGFTPSALQSSQNQNQEERAAQSRWQLEHLRAENAEMMLRQAIPADILKSVVIQVDSTNNSINFIGTARAVQAASQMLQSIDKPQPNVQETLERNETGEFVPASNLSTISPPIAPPSNFSQNPSLPTQPQPPVYLNQQPSQNLPVATPQFPQFHQSTQAQNAQLQNPPTPPVGLPVSSEPNEPGTYFCKPSRLEMISRELQQRYKNNRNIAIDFVPESGKILVWAPQRAHQEIVALMNQTHAWAEIPPGRDPRELEGTLVRFSSGANGINSSAGNSASSATEKPVMESHIPKFTTIDAIENKLQTLFGQRMTALPDSNDKIKKYRIAIPKPQHTAVCELTLNMPDYRLEVKAPPKIAGEFITLVQAMDQESPEEGYDRKFISVQKTDAEKVKKLLEIYRLKAQPNSGRNSLRRKNWYDAGIRQVSYTQQEEGGINGGVSNAGISSGAIGDAAGAFSGDPLQDTTNIQLIAQPETKIQVLSDLDVVIIDAPMSEVQRIMDMITQLEKISEHAEPQIEVLFLKNVQCQSLYGILNMPLRTTVSPLTGIPTTVYLYTEMFAAKQGRVWVIPLLNPNAILLVGWGQSLEAMKSLIEKLDQPVNTGNSILRVIKLESAPATEIAESLTNFFNEQTALAAPGMLAPGFQPRIRVLSDPRTNSLIVQAAPNDYRDIERVVAELDVPKGGPKLQVRTFKMKNVLAADMVTALNNALDMAMHGTQDGRLPIVEIILDTPEGRKVIESGFLSEVTIAPNAGNNTVIITAPSNCMSLMTELITMLDTTPGIAVVKVIQINHSDAETIQRTLQTLIPSQMAGNGGVQLPGADGGETFIPLKIAIDTRSNSIVVAGSENDIQFIDLLIKKLDQKDAIQRKTKTYQLKNSSATDVSQAVTNYLQKRTDLQDAEVISPYQKLESAAIVVPEPVSNVLVINAAEEYMKEIEDMIKVLDQEPPQVVIQVLVGEVTLSDADEFGIELGLQDPLLFNRSVVSEPTMTPGFSFNDLANGLGNASGVNSLATAGTVGTQMLSNFATGRVNNESGFGGLVFSASSDAVSVLIRAMQERSRLEVLSRPQIQAQDNQLGIVFVGQKVSRASGTDTTQYGLTQRAVDQDVGLFLGVIPRISKGENGEPDKVVMLISASKSSVGGANDGMPIVSNGTIIRVPNINQIRTETIVSALDGETVLLGGLISTDKQQLNRRVPYLSDIPLVGRLFRYDYEKQKRSELILIMRPRIIRKTEDAEEIKRVEAARMSWCLPDVTRIHGDIGVYNTTSRSAKTEIGVTPRFAPEPVNRNELQPLTTAPAPTFPIEPPTLGIEPPTLGGER
ncbi:MAG: hypothetical protein LBJ67_16930 [Planctomycetaceae bacterium]|nr:hypothetical protein [Planctomycetaceae bacterium]